MIKAELYVVQIKRDQRKNGGEGRHKTVTLQIMLKCLEFRTKSLVQAFLFGCNKIPFKVTQEKNKEGLECITRTQKI